MLISEGSPRLLEKGTLPFVSHVCPVKVGIDSSPEENFHGDNAEKACGSDPPVVLKRDA